jgi:RNA 3'-terminal phosphate cyclase
VATPLQIGAPVGLNLTDLLLLPPTMAGGMYITARLMQHILTNVETINAYVPSCLDTDETADGMTLIF